jgi:hypothetical protein
LLNTNLSYVGSEMDKVKWRINLASIYNHAKHIFGYEKMGEYHKEAVVLMGEKSYQFGLEIFRSIFPMIQEHDLKIIKGAGKV